MSIGKIISSSKSIKRRTLINFSSNYYLYLIVYMISQSLLSLALHMIFYSYYQEHFFK
jgi:uncharacterized membrane protein